MQNFGNNKTQPNMKQKPNDEQVECAVLGAVLLSSNIVSEIFGDMNSGMFYNPKNRIVYDAIVHLYCNSIVIDILTVSKRIREAGLSERTSSLYVMSLTSEVMSTANVKQHLIILKELQIRRELIEHAEKLLASAQNAEEDVFETLEQADTHLVKITSGLFGADTTPMDEAMVTSIDEVLFLSENGGALTLPSGVEELDKLMGGFFSGELSIIAGRPSMGKTTVALNILRTVAMQGHNVGFMSLEMSTQSLAFKEIVTEFYRHNPNTQIDVIRLRMGKLFAEEKELLKKVRDNINQYLHRIKICQKSALPLGTIKSKAKEWVRKHNIKLLVIDYLQLIGDDNGKKTDNRNLEIERIANGLKSLSKELNIPIIALAQLNRGVESRAIKVPQLSDLRDSGGIEQAADNITFLYRPEYYDIQQDEQGNSTAGLLQLVVAKNRNGGLGKAETDVNLKAGTMHPRSNVDFGVKNTPTPSQNTDAQPTVKTDEVPF
jgi:replicative DNA helicase